ncbi:MAG: hypothetical protein ACRCY9_08260 [Phycicoccus sp.]
METGGAERLAAEQRAWGLIDRPFDAARWHVHDVGSVNLLASHGVAVRERAMTVGHGRADHLVNVDQCPAGVTEAKPQGTMLSGSSGSRRGTPPA